MSTLSKKFLSFKEYNSSGTWLKPKGCRAILVFCLGGGRGTTAAGSSSFSTCVGTAGSNGTGGTVGTGGDLNLTSSPTYFIGPVALAALVPSLTVFGMGAIFQNISRRDNIGAASYSGADNRMSGGGALKLFLASDLPDSVAVTVGAGGGGANPSATAGKVWIMELG